MTLGPVLRFELITTARRGRYYLARFVYGLFLLYTVWVAYVSRWNYALVNRMTPHDMAAFAQAMFSALAWLQWIAVLVVVPAMTAGVIADAYRRKTLRDLLCSGLSAKGIVFGKLAARLVHVAALVAVGIPVVALIGLFGGLDPMIVSAVYAGTASIAFAVGGVSILASTLARRPREAILAAYAIEIGWLILPPVFGALLPHMIWPFPLFNPLNQFLIETNPTVVASQMSQMSYFSSNPAMSPWIAGMVSRLHYAIAMMIGLQTILGLVCVGTSAYLIRRLRAGDREGMPSRSWLDVLLSPFRKGRKPRISAIRRPDIGDDPMMWKEWHATSRGGLAWLVSGPAALVLGVLLGCYLFEIARPAFLETWNFQQSGFPNGRTELNSAVRYSSMWLLSVWLLAVASAAAVGITSEREDDTWTSLTATLVSGPEVVRAKIWGALWGTRRLAFALITVIAVGVLGGGTHPLGGLIAITGMVAFGVFTAALGVWWSLRMSNSTRSLVWTVVVLFLVNIAVPSILASFYALIKNWPREESTWMMVVTIPFLEYSGLISYADVHALARGETIKVGDSANTIGVEILVIILTGQVLYALAAILLWSSAGRVYDRVAGRAFRKPAVRASRLGIREIMT